MLNVTKKIFTLLGIASLFWSLSYAAEPVAINERTNTSYATLQEAFSANEVRAGDSIKLLKDIDEVNEMTNVAENSFSSISIEKDIILKGNWFEIKRPKTYLGTLFTIQWGTNVTFSGVVIDGQAPDWKQNFNNILPTEKYVERKIDEWIHDVIASKSSIINNGKLIFKNSFIKNMLVRNHNWAGILSNDGSSLHIQGSQFIHIGADKGHWGAIYATQGTQLLVQDSLFNNTSVGWFYHGGGIFIAGGLNETKPIIENSIFKNNYAMNSPGIDIRRHAFEIRWCQFINNKAGNDGVAFQVGSDLNENSPIKNLPSIVEDSLFSGNIGLSEIHSQGIITLSSFDGKRLDIKNSNFTANYTKMGIISDYWSENTQINIINSNFIKNKSFPIYWRWTKYILKHSSLIENYAIAILSQNSSLTTEDTLLTNNGNQGKPIYSNILVYPNWEWMHPKVILKKGTIATNNIGNYGFLASYWGNDKNQKATIIMEPGSKVYNNKGLIGGDDFYFLRSLANAETNRLEVQIQPAISMDAKDQNGENILGWFSDRGNSRYSPLSPQENPSPLTVGVDGTLNYSGAAATPFALKAATKDQTPPSLQQINQQRIKRNKPILITFTGSDNLKIKSLEPIGNLPEGLTLQKKEISDKNRETTISGAITKSGTYPLSFIITDFFGNSSVMSFDLVIYNPSNTDINTSNSWTSQQNQSVVSHWTEKTNTEETEHNAAETKASTETKAEDKPEPVEGKTKYQDTVIFNPTIENGKCYTRREYLGIKDSEKIVTSEEFKKALSFLRSYEMTMFDSVEGFAPKRNLSREEAAKIFSNFAINVLCRKPDTNLSVNYSDVENANPTLKPYITLAYQLGVMKGSGMGDGKFRPKEYISKAEVNAVLIRMILKSYLDENKSENKVWYAEYNKVATDLGIINQGAGAEPVLRNNVALMLFRAYKNQVFDWRNVDYFSYVLESRDLFVK